MRFRRTLFLAAALAALALAAWLGGPGSPLRRPPSPPRLFEPGEALVSRIEIDAPGGRTVLDRSGGEWMAGEGAGARKADGDAVDRLVSHLSDLNWGEVASTNPARRGEFGLGEGEGVRLRAWAGPDLAADVHVGRQGPDLFSTFLRAGSAGDVLLVRVSLRPLVDRSPEAWFAAERTPPAPDPAATPGEVP